ncbi:hypothetical protein LXA47_26360 [Massilia sp. P8910]|uniref:hypothetical protein n=1 Tax=Massilia antarctica TaxID=2765360 RepID=UPI0006BB8128|nr:MULTISPECIES: hypothetical protein [Massilia]MCE3607096.1 hypothetical protein [Massilia antarctica]MCY0916126.1 hypothetical protein [Massilia sp. H27-R4]CUI05964.1 hypothetical protein BN2497_6705 [Janthinobacterium sp. CG23_2]CUU29750.1 hypothetical protein BN3177_6705 [Janthinobacterium sp. CG23_2]
MKKLVVCIACLTASTLLAAPARAPAPTIKMTTESEYYLRPEKGALTTAEIGEALYEEGVKLTTRKFRATLGDGVKASLDNGYALNLPKGSSGMIMARPNSPSNMLCFLSKVNGVMTFFAGGTVNACLVDMDNDLIFDHAEFEGYAKIFPISNPVPYTVAVVETKILDQDALVVQVIYQGISKGELKFSFREFKNGLARPAFTQDITYELARDGTSEIGFRGFRMKVQKATNTNVDFVLQQPVTSMAEYRAKAAAQAEDQANDWWKKSTAP